MYFPASKRHKIQNKCSMGMTPLKLVPAFMIWYIWVVVILGLEQFINFLCDTQCNSIQHMHTHTHEFSYKSLSTPALTSNRKLITTSDKNAHELMGKHFCLHQKSSAHIGTSYAENQGTSIDSHSTEDSSGRAWRDSHMHTYDPF